MNAGMNAGMNPGMNPGASHRRWPAALVTVPRERYAERTRGTSE